MAGCVFREPLQIELLAKRMDECRNLTGHRREFKFNKTRDKVKVDFFDRLPGIDFSVRAIIFDKERLTSTKLRSDPKALKSYAIRMLLSKNWGQIQNSKVVIDGQDTKGFGIDDTKYLMRMVNRESPNSIQAVRFDDSSVNIGIQLADMVAGAIHRGFQTHRPADMTYFNRVRHRTYQPKGSLWQFCR